MPPPKPSPEERRLAKVYEAGSRAYAWKRAKFVGGWTEKIQGAELTCCPYWDFINGIHSPPWQAEEVGECLGLSLEKFRDWGQAMTVTDGPSVRAANLRSELLRRGFRCNYYIPYFQLDLSRKIERVRVPKGVNIELLQDLSVFEKQAHPWVGPLTTSIRKRTMGFMRSGCEARKPFIYHFVARENGEFVGSAYYFAHKGNVVLYDVGVIKSRRKIGIGLAMVTALCLHAQENGFKAAGLGASGKGAGLYLKAGFREAGRYGFYALSRGRVAKS